MDIRNLARGPAQFEHFPKNDRLRNEDACLVENRL